MIDLTKIKVLDLFCGAGGAAKGLYNSGLTDITGVDISPQPHYPFKFIQADAIDFDISGYDFIWASPPCQAHSWAAKQHINQRGYFYQDCLLPTQMLLYAAVVPYVIENVPLAPLRDPITLCGIMFNLRVVRHRIFEYGRFDLDQPMHNVSLCRNAVKTGYALTAAGHGGGKKHGQSTRLEDLSLAMGIDWMTKPELNESVPPAYGEYIGRQFINSLSDERR